MSVEALNQQYCVIDLTLSPNSAQKIIENFKTSIKRLSTIEGDQNDLMALKAATGVQKKLHEKLSQEYLSLATQLGSSGSGIIVGT